MMNFEQQFNKLFPNKDSEQSNLIDDQRSAIESRADLRKRGQKFKIDLNNLEQPSATDSMKMINQKILALVFAEADGKVENSDKSNEQLNLESETLIQKAKQNEELFPNLSASYYAQATKNKEVVGEDFQDPLADTKRCLDASANISKNSPSSFMPDAILLGIQKRQADKLEMPAPEIIASAVIDNPKLLADYALVLPEDQRAEFLVLIPEEKRQFVSRALDASASQVLHQSIIEKKSTEETQRSRVRGRMFAELKNVVETGEKGDKQMAKILAQAIGGLGEDTRQLLLEIMREEVVESQNKEQNSESKKENYLPRVIKVFLDNFEDWRGNDVVLKLAGDKDVDRHLAIYLLNKLIKNNYIPSDVKTWWDKQKEVGAKGLAGEKQKLEIIQSVITELGVVPSQDILKFIADDDKWDKIPLTERIEKIKASQKEFENIKDNHELAKRLNKNENEAMTYYLLHGGDDRFNLINNYSFNKFKEMIGLIDDLKIHSEPLQVFEESLSASGVSKQESKKILERLTAGKYPLENSDQARQEVSFNVSENAIVKNANFEIGGVLGKKQLGVVLLFPLYREYLEQNKNNPEAKEFIETMKNTQTFNDRLTLINKIESAFPELKNKAIAELQDDWRTLGEKMVLELSLEQVFNEENITIKGEELMPRLDAKRIDLKKIKKDLLIILKGGNKQITALQKEILKKKKARAGLLAGLEKQTDEKQKTGIQKKIERIEGEINSLEKERITIGDLKTAERFAHLSAEEKKIEVEKLGKEILALTEKSPSAIFTYLTMQVFGENRLRENDIALVQEMESHLQGPFQSIVDATTYQKPVDVENKKRMKIQLEYLDKTERFMNMVRFADSKICCFSSSNYEQQIQHDTPNKYWVASINADPLSFVVSLEMPTPAEDENKKNTPKENLGFIFGSFGVDENKELAIMLNGIYYAPGIEDKQQVEQILSGVEKIFAGLPIKTTAIAEQHGGSLGKKIPEGYTNEAVELTRLRALDDNSGDPETKIYDDLNTGSDLNKAHDYGENVWHKINNL